MTIESGITMGRRVFGTLRSRLSLVFLFASMIASSSAETPAVPVSVKWAPENTSLSENGIPLVTRQGENGARIVSLAAGRHRILVQQNGYIPKTVTVDVAGKPVVIEGKLEREGTRLRLVAVISTLQRPKSVEFTPDGKHLVIAPLSGRSPQVFKAGTWEKITDMTVPGAYAKQEGFVETAFPAGRDEIWISQMHTSSIHVFDLGTFAYKTTLPSGGQYPKVLLGSPDGSRVYVSNWVTETVSVIDASSGLCLAKIKTGGIPRGLASSTDGKTLYVANFEKGTIDVIDTAALSMTKSLLGGGAKRHLVMSKDGSRMYISDMHGGTVSVMKLPEGKLSAERAVGENPNTIKLSPDEKWLYVTTRGPNNPENYEIKGPRFGELLVLDADSLEIKERHWGGNQPTRLSVSPDGKWIVFTDFLDNVMEVYE